MEIVNSLLKSKNWVAGRAGPYPLDTICVHVMEGTEDAANSWFENESSDVSSNYGISRNGRIEMYVREEDTAWAQGRVFNPTARRVLKRLDANPNSYIISIEFEGSGKEPLTEAQKVSGAWLIRDIAERRQIEISRESVIGHHEIYAKKTCPGAISVTELVRLAVGAPPLITDPPRIVWSPSLDDYLVVTRYVSDSEWYFYRMKELTRGTRAGARLSDMPLKP